MTKKQPPDDHDDDHNHNHGVVDDDNNNNDNDDDDKEYRKILYETRKYSGEQFDKLIVYLSSGALVLTVGFVENIIDLARATKLCLLYISWMCFCFSLLLILSSHLTSMAAIDKDIRREDKASSRYNMATHILNWASIIILLLGIVFFIVFVATALSKKGG